MTLLGDASGGSGNSGGSQGGSGNAGGGSGGQGNAGSGSGSGGQGAGQGASGAGDGGTSGGSGSGAAASWRDSLPADLKGNAALQSFTTVENLAKSYIHAQSLVGKKGHVLPTDKSAPEDWNTLYDALGRPSIDKYEVKAPEGVDSEFINRFKQTVHKEGLLPKQAQAILDWSRSEAQTQSEAQVAEAKAKGEKQIGSLKQEWGKDWDGNVKLAIRAADHAAPEFRQYLEKTGLGNDVEVIKALSKLGKLLGEDSLRQSGSTGGSGALDAGQIDNEIMKIRAEPEFLSLQSSAKKDLLNKRLAELYQQKYSA